MSKVTLKEVNAHILCSSKLIFAFGINGYSSFLLHVVQKGTNITGLWLLSFESPADKVGPWKVSGNLNFGRIPSISWKEWLTVPRLHSTNNMVYAEQLLPFWDSGIVIRARQRVPMWSVSSKNSGHRLSNEPLWLATFYMYCHNSFQGELRSTVCLPGWELWKLAAGFLQSPPHVPFFPFAEFTWCNHSCENNCMLSAVSSRESPNLGVVWGPPTHIEIRFDRKEYIDLRILRT